jgi:hypothetical protein
MGNGNSTLTTLQGRELARLMKHEYAACMERGLTGEDLQVEVMKKYRQNLSHVNDNPLKIVTGNTRRFDRGTSSAAHGKKRAQRRMTFDGPHRSDDDRSRKQCHMNAPGHLSVSESVHGLSSHANLNTTLSNSVSLDQQSDREGKGE